MKQRIAWATEIARLVRPLTARLQRDALDELAEGLADGVKLPPDTRMTRPEEVARVLRTTLLRLLQQWSDEDAAAGRAIAEWADLSFEVTDPTERREILQARIEASPGSWWQRLGDLRALSRNLDWDAWSERLAMVRGACWTRERLALEVIEGLHDPAVTESRSGVLALYPNPTTAEATVEALMPFLQADSHPMVRRAAGLAIGAVLKRTPAAREGTAKHHASALSRLARSEPANRWVRTTAVDVLALLPFRAVADDLLGLLDETTEDGDGFLVRAHAAAALLAHATTFPDLPDRLAAEAANPRTGEYVRLALLQAAGSLPAERRMPWIVRLGTIEVARQDPSPVVRGRLAQALAAGLGLPLADPSSGRAAVALIERLAGSDPDPIARRVAQRAAASIAPVLAAGDALPEAPAALVAALAARFRRADRADPVEHERLAGLIESVRIASDASSAALRERIAATASAMKWGARRTIAVPVPDPHDLGRVLADLTREDAGLYAEPSAQAVRLQRGERFRRRVWRTLFEVANPRSNKRQDVSHCIGRTYLGHIRAHPAVLAEVTPTLVPGERVFVDTEGGWARYLPLVDDLLDLQPVRLYSSFGVTTILPPPDGGARFRARVVLSLRYARYAALRLEALREPEAHRKAAYIAALKEDLGIEVTFRPWRYLLHGVEVDLGAPHVLACFGGEVSA